MLTPTKSTQGSLYRMDKDHSVHKMLGNIAISNGIVWTADKKTMYYIDTYAYNVRAFDYDNATGNIANERVALSKSPKAWAHPTAWRSTPRISLGGALWRFVCASLGSQ